MDRAEARALPPGSSEHYSAYVGPSAQYDFMGATQFRLACALGLRGQHRLLDFGCGSLRAGRLFLVYLDPGCYFGIEPNSWLVQDAIRAELGGDDLVRAKRPHFSDSAEFDSRVFDAKFDFIVAQSIFSHCGLDLIRKTLEGFAATLAPGGIVMATFLTPPNAQDFDGSGWVYPGCVFYAQETIEREAASLGLSTLHIPWFHPRQDWYLFARDPHRLPTPVEAERHLTGTLLGPSDIRDERTHPL